MSLSKVPSHGVLFFSFCLVFPQNVWALEVSPEILQTALDVYSQRQHGDQPGILLPVTINPKLVGKKVVVTDRVGRRHKGKLFAARMDFLSVEVGRDLIEIPFTDVAWIEFKRRSFWLGPRTFVLPVRMSRELIGMKGLVRDRAGREYKGRLIDVETDLLHLKVKRDRVEVPLTEVAFIELQKPYEWKKGLAISSIVTAVIVIIVVALVGEGEG